MSCFHVRKVATTSSETVAAFDSDFDYEVLAHAAERAEFQSIWNMAIGTAGRLGHVAAATTAKAIVSDDESDLEPSEADMRPCKRARTLKQMDLDQFESRIKMQRQMQRENLALGFYGPEPGHEAWIEPLLEIVNSDVLHNTLKKMKDSRDCGDGADLTISYGSDCSGVDAPAIALKSLFAGLHKHFQDVMGHGPWAMGHGLSGCGGG